VALRLADMATARRRALVLREAAARRRRARAPDADYLCNMVKVFRGEVFKVTQHAMELHGATA